MAKYALRDLKQIISDKYPIQSFAKLVHMPRSTLYYYFDNPNETPSSLLLDVCSFLNLSPEQLFIKLDD